MMRLSAAPKLGLGLGKSGIRPSRRVDLGVLPSCLLVRRDAGTTQHARQWCSGWLPVKRQGVVGRGRLLARDVPTGSPLLLLHAGARWFGASGRSLNEEKGFASPFFRPVSLRGCVHGDAFADLAALDLKK